MNKFNLNYEIIGKFLVNLVLLSKDLNHTKLKSSVENAYVIYGGMPESDFVKDCFTMDTNEIIEKWFGGEEGYSELLQSLKEF